MLAYVKRSLVAKEIGRVAADATEVLAFSIRLRKNKYNVYVPPVSSKGQDVIDLRTDVTSCFKSSLSGAT